jgi:hypothetical protein
MEQEAAQELLDCQIATKAGRRRSGFVQVFGLYLERPRDALVCCYKSDGEGALDTAT